MSDHLRFLWQNLPNLLIGFPQQRPGGLLLSILLAIASLGLGFLVATLVGSGRASQNRLWRGLCLVYIEIFRGLPLILLLFLIHQGLGGRRFGLDLRPYQSALIALTLYTSAYQAEIVRAGLQTVPQQLIDSAKLVGGSAWQIYWGIKLKYTLKTMLPAFTGQAISLFKDTSVVVVLGVGELLTVARTALGSDITNTTYWVSLYMLVGLLYLSVALVASNMAKHWEKKRTSTDLVYSLANA
jgi:His/Glu/Gln/Arg/opine family amino acid ABC transporter permease subunit